MPASGIEQVRQAVADLRDMPREIRREITPALRRAAQPIVRDAKTRAAWSRRIPGAIRVAVLKKGVVIKVSRKKAPHARPYEGISGTSVNFRHPLFGDRDRWVAQRTRPFLAPAARAHRGEVRDAVVQVVDDAARRHGFR